jgi:hypothetical protein
MSFGGGDSLGKPDNQAQPLVDRGRQSRLFFRFEQRLFQWRDRAARFLRLDLAQESERLGTLSACRRAGDELASKSARSLDLARGKLRARNLEGASTGVRVVLHRRQAKRMLA